MMNKHTPGLTSPLEAAMAVSEDGCVFVLRAKTKGPVYYYTGNAGYGYISTYLEKAFPFQTKEGADRKAAKLNETCILKFDVIGVAADDLIEEEAEEPEQASGQLSLDDKWDEQTKYDWRDSQGGTK